MQPASSVALPEKTPTLSKKKDETIYNIRYTVPVADFVQQNIPGGRRVQIGAGTIAFNQYGRPVSRISQKFTLSFTGDKLTKVPNCNIYFDQQFSIPKGQDYLVVAVWDTTTGRLGTVQVPVNVEKRAEAKH